MSKSPARTNAIKNFVLKNVVEHPDDICSIAAKEFQVSRQSISRHLKNLVEEGVLESTGNTRAREYSLKAKPPNGVLVVFEVDHTLEEDEIWRSYILPQLTGASENVIRICEFGFTEMVNNVVDHSKSKLMLVGVNWDDSSIELKVMDQGVGIFNKLQSELGLSDPRHAILELSKGKLTTNEDSHTGEGIFFTSKMFDRFIVDSQGIAYAHGHERLGIILDTEMDDGTSVYMRIKDDAKQTMQEVFDEFAAGTGDYRFNKTWLTLNLAKYGQEDLVSRSQAKRVLARIDQFNEVVLDFTDVDNIGPSFADEIFRVFANSHPEVRFLPFGTTPSVDKAIQRASRH